MSNQPKVLDSDRVERHRISMKWFEDNMETITHECPICREESEIFINKEYYAKGMKMRAKGALIQDAFPDSPAEVREFLMTGMCFDCQLKIFGEPDDDEFEFIELDGEDFELDEFLDEFEEVTFR